MILNLAKTSPCGDWHQSLFNQLLHTCNLRRQALTDGYDFFVTNPLSVNMGRQAGHTTFAKKCAYKSSPMHSKVLTPALNFKPYSKSLMQGSCHELIDVLEPNELPGIKYSKSIELFIIDMAFLSVVPYKSAILNIQSHDHKPIILILQPKFF